MRTLDGFNRREVLAGLGGSGLILSGAAGAARVADRRRDWAWLEGNWKVDHRRLRRRLAQDTNWDRFAGTSAVWLTLGGTPVAKRPNHDACDVRVECRVDEKRICIWLTLLTRSIACVLLLSRRSR